MTPDGLHTWQYKDEDIDKLKNPQIKALFITNPSNPPRYAPVSYTHLEQGIGNISKSIVYDNINSDGSTGVSPIIFRRRDSALSFSFGFIL